MQTRAQGSLEYIMLLAGVLLVVALAITMVRTGVLDKAVEILRTNHGVLINATNLANCTPTGCYASP